MIKDKLEFDGAYNVIKSQRYINNELIEESNYNSFGDEISYQYKKNDYEYTLNENGKYHGLYRRYYPNGDLWLEFNYKNGKQHGLSRDYYNNGKLCQEYNYENGNII